MGALYGAEASKAGLTLAETVEAFLFFRSPVLDAIVGHLRRRSAEVADVTAAFHEANAAIDQRAHGPRELASREGRLT